MALASRFGSQVLTIYNLIVGKRMHRKEVTVVVYDVTASQPYKTQRGKLEL